jgi:hypothetical protein
MYDIVCASMYQCSGYDVYAYMCHTMTSYSCVEHKYLRTRHSAFGTFRLFQEFEFQTHHERKLHDDTVYVMHIR